MPGSSNSPGNFMATFIAIYGSVALLAAILGGIIAAVKRRDVSYWATVILLFPPAILILLLMQSNRGPRPRRESWDEQEAREAGRDDTDRVL